MPLTHDPDILDPGFLVQGMAVGKLGLPQGSALDLKGQAAISQYIRPDAPASQRHLYLGWKASRRQGRFKHHLGRMVFSLLARASLIAAQVLEEGLRLLRQD